jgi:hypothetical protein
LRKNKTPLADFSTQDKTMSPFDFIANEGSSAWLEGLDTICAKETCEKKTSKIINFFIF